MICARCFTWKFNLVPSYTRTHSYLRVHISYGETFTTLLKNFHHLAIPSGREIIQLPFVFPLIKWNLEWLTLDPSHLRSNTSRIQSDTPYGRWYRGNSLLSFGEPLMILFLVCGKNRVTRRFGEINFRPLKLSITLWTCSFWRWDY